MDITATYTDLYQISMGHVYVSNGHHTQEATFDYFFRKLPFNGGYVVFAGLYDLLETLKSFTFTDEEIIFLEKQGFPKDYLRELEKFRFQGRIYSMQEGDLAFPYVPMVRVEGTIFEAQLIETVLLNLLNFQSLIATKAARVRQVAPGKILMDFGLRRAQGLGAYHAARATIVGGFDATSNVKAGLDFNIPVSGTMAHSFIQHFDDELSAFRSYAESRPQKCVLLVDTYNTLKSGVPNAITVGKELEARGQRLEGIRLDSGDLAYLSKHARKMLDEAGLNYVKISASNQLDENVIKSLLEQGAPIDIFGVGTNLVTGQPDAALDGVYKLCQSDGKPRIKLSESLSKTTLPGKKQVFRVFENEHTLFGADAIALSSEQRVDIMHHPFEPDNSMAFGALKQEPLLSLVMQDGEVMVDKRDLKEIGAFSMKRLKSLPSEYKRFENPHTYKVGISTALKEQRDDLRKQYLAKP